MCVCGGGGVGVNIEWGTLPYPTELKWKVGVKCVCVGVWWGGGGRGGYPTAPYPTLRSSSGL